MLSDFWAKNYTAIKTANAKLPILLRESNGTVAKLTATYGAQTPFFSDCRAFLLLCVHALMSVPTLARRPQNLAWRRRSTSRVSPPTLSEGSLPR